MQCFSPIGSKPKHEQAYLLSQGIGYRQTSIRTIPALITIGEHHVSIRLLKFVPVPILPKQEKDQGYRSTNIS